MSIVKVILVGDSNVGKTAIIKQYINYSFEEDLCATLAAFKSRKEININENTLNLELWDTSGSQSYRAVNKIYMRNIDIALLIYDVTNRISFEELNYWIQEVKEINNYRKVLFVVIGNKCDLYEERVIEEEEGKKFANNNNALFFETSAKDYDSVENAFFRICEKYLNEKKEEIKAKKEGKEVIKYDNGNKYIGFIKNNKREGNGIMNYKNGDIYEDEWKNNLKEGKGIMNYKSGDKYEGIWKNDKKEGNCYLF